MILFYFELNLSVNVSIIEVRGHILFELLSGRFLLRFMMKYRANSVHNIPKNSWGNQSNNNHIDPLCRCSRIYVSEANRYHRYECKILAYDVFCKPIIVVLVVNDAQPSRHIWVVFKLFSSDVIESTTCDLSNKQNSYKEMGYLVENRIFPNDLKIIISAINYRTQLWDAKENYP